MQVEYHEVSHISLDFVPGNRHYEFLVLMTSKKYDEVYDGVKIEKAESPEQAMALAFFTRNIPTDWKITNLTPL